MDMDFLPAGESPLQGKSWKILSLNWITALTLSSKQSIGDPTTLGGGGGVGGRKESGGHTSLVLGERCVTENHHIAGLGKNKTPGYGTRHTCQVHIE